MLIEANIEEIPRHAEPDAHDERLERFAANVRRLREARGGAQAQLAELLGVSRAVVYALETGQREPKLGEAYRLADFFGSNVVELGRPWTCQACQDYPPKGFTCNECGARS